MSTQTFIIIIDFNFYNLIYGKIIFIRGSRCLWIIKMLLFFLKLYSTIFYVKLRHAIHLQLIYLSASMIKKAMGIKSSHQRKVVFILDPK